MANLNPYNMASSREIHVDGITPTEMQVDDKVKESTSLEQKVQMRLALEKKAHQIVERLLDNPVTEEFLLDCASSIYPQHYQDAVIERSIIKHCGYPLCQRSLGNIPKQKYHICRKTNKVYDITDRKCFCSQFCYKASKFYEAQLSESPLWMRNIDEFLDISILTRDMEGDLRAASLIAKDDVILSERIQSHEVDESGSGEKSTLEREEMLGLLEDDLSTLTLADARKERLQELSYLNRFPEKEFLKQEKINSHKTDKTESSAESTPLQLSDTVSPMQNDEMGTHAVKESNLKIVKEERPGDITHSNTDCFERPISMDSWEVPGDATASSCNVPLKSFQEFEDAACVSPEGTKKKTNQKAKQSSPDVARVVPLLEVVFRVVKEWSSEETRTFLLGNPVTGKRQNSEVMSSTNLKPDKYLSLSECQAMNTDHLVNFGVSSLPPVKPLPDLKQLKEETEQFALKVQEFYSGTHVGVEEKTATSRKRGEKKDDSIDRSLRLPLVDSRSQMAIRRKILSDQLNRVYSDILAPLGLSVRNVSTDLRALIQTFKLSSTNITFKPAGWTLLGIVILHILSCRNPLIQESLAQEASRHFLNSLLCMMDSNVKQVASQAKELCHLLTLQHGNGSGHY